MKRFVLCALLLSGPAFGAPGVADRVPIGLGRLTGTGQPADPRVGPGGTHLSFEFLGADGESLETFLLDLGDPRARPQPILPSRRSDPFALGRMSKRPVSEGVGWGPPKRGRPRLVVAATRRAVARGAGQTNFDLFLVEPGRRRFLTEHPDNDAQPAFSPNGEFLAFSSGRSGQGDLYLYHFFAVGAPLVRATDATVGSELFPAWAPDGARLAYTAHVGSQDHIQVIDEVGTLAEATDETRLRTLRKRLTRDLTPGWRGSCLAPQFSPDGRWIAYYARPLGRQRADLYIVPAGGGLARKLLEGGVPETRGGPRWSPRSDGLVVVLDSAERRNPLLWVPLDGAKPTELETGTELNADPWLAAGAEEVDLYWTAQGVETAVEKRWRRIFRARWVWDEAKP